MVGSEDAGRFFREVQQTEQNDCDPGNRFLSPSFSSIHGRIPSALLGVRKDLSEFGASKRLPSEKINPAATFVL
jgi:hypothetical protein